MADRRWTIWRCSLCGATWQRPSHAPAPHCLEHFGTPLVKVGEKAAKEEAEQEQRGDPEV